MGQLENYWDEDHKKLTGDYAPSNYGVAVANEFPKSSFILDIGGGRGRDSIFFLQQGHKVLMFDISPFAVAQAVSTAQELNLNLQAEVINVGEQNLPVPDKSVDAVYSHLALHYFDLKITVKVLSEIHRVLKDGGKFFATIKSPEDKKDMARILEFTTEVSQGYFIDREGIKRQSRFTIEQWQDMLTKAGFTNFTVQLIDENVARKEQGKSVESKELLVNEIRAIK